MLSEQAVLSPRWPHPFKIILSPKSSGRLGVLGMATGGLGLFLEGG